MTNVKLFDTFRFYQKYLDETFPGTVPQRMNITQPVVADASGNLYAHLKWACEQGKIFVEERRFEKAMRWLGFIQGCLAARGHFTIDEMGNHSRPPEPPYTTEYVAETTYSCDLKMEMIAKEETEVRRGCSHVNAAGQSLVQRSNNYCAVCEREVL